jgi:hypothetical protein
VADLCVSTALDTGLDSDRFIGGTPRARLIGRALKGGPRVWFLVAWVAGNLLFLGFSVALDHESARTQSDSMVCKRP